MSLYKNDGVDVLVGDSFSAIAGEVCRGSFKNSRYIEVVDLAPTSFRGPRAYRPKNLPPNCSFDIAPDGIGTKVVIIDAARAYGGGARDLVAMTAADITRWGGKPLLFVNILDVATLGENGSEKNNAFRALMNGLELVAKQQEFVCFRGETAELGKCVQSENPDALALFNWGGFMLGALDPRRLITGDTLAAGHIVVALREEGFRSNGLSSVRAAFKMRFGEEWWNNPYAENSIQLAARPSILYDRFLAGANGWEDFAHERIYLMHLITHISGGGIVGKFAEDMLFPRGLSAELDSLFAPPSIMQNVAEWRGMSARECYETFNGGNGTLVVLDAEEVEGFCARAQWFGIDAKPAGRIFQDDQSSPSLLITSQFNNEILEYKPKSK